MNPVAQIPMRMAHVWQYSTALKVWAGSSCLSCHPHCRQNEEFEVLSGDSSHSSALPQSHCSQSEGVLHQFSNALLGSHRLLEVACGVILTAQRSAQHASALHVPTWAATKVSVSCGVVLTAGRRGRRESMAQTHDKPAMRPRRCENSRAPCCENTLCKGNRSQATELFRCLECASIAK